VSRWIDGVLEKNELIDQDSNLRGVFFWGHAPNSQTRGLEMKKAMDKLDLLVVVDPVSVGHRGDGGHARQSRRT
jgi:formate dehydrogenase major subunit